MNKAFTILECLVILFIITIMLNLSLNFLQFESSLKVKDSSEERGE
jgi:competence protein ComGC